MKSCHDCTLATHPPSHLNLLLVTSRLEMEEERVSWEIEELNYDFLDNYFEKKAQGRKLSFTDFMAFENVQAEIWYHDGKGTLCYLPKVCTKLIMQIRNQ